MAYKHGVYKSEVPTSVISPSQGESGLPVIFGTAPIFMAENGTVNQPVLCYSYEEAVKAFGYSEDWEKYTLCEFIYSQFALYGQSPAVLVNVLDLTRHKESVAASEKSLISGSVDLGSGVISTSLKVFTLSEDDEPERTEYESGRDYVASYDEDGHLILSVTSSGRLYNALSVQVSYDVAKPESVTSSDIIGGIDASTGNAKGLEVVSSVFPKLRLIPGLIGAPKWSTNPGVAAVMRAKTENINGLFTCQAVIDIPCDREGAPVYSSVPEWKNSNNYIAEREIVCWPKVKLDDKVFWLSTQLIGLMNRTDSNHDDVPYKSPSNEALQINGVVNAAGDEIDLGLEQANYLNSQGIVTALNFMSGWVAWGNRTGAYPGNTDPKDAFIPIRRMFDYVSNTFITTFWQKTDDPMNQRLIRTIVDSFNMYLNGLTAREMILGGRIEFKEDENVTTDLMNGILRFHVYMTPAPPAEDIEGIFEFDTDYLNELYSSLV